MLRGGRLAVTLSIGLIATVVSGCGDDVAPGLHSEPGTHLLAVGPSHVCAWRQAGVYCWTVDFGSGAGVGAAVPAKVALDASDVVELAAAGDQACARRRSGEVACWSVDESGPGTPMTVAGLAGARQLAVDAQSACALVEDGAVACWGSDLAHAADSGVPEASIVPGLGGVVELRGGAGNSYCTRAEDRSVRCLSLAEDGASWSLPIQVSALAGASAIAMTSADSVCGILPSSEVKCVKPVSGVGATLAGSLGSVQLRASGGLSACAKDQADQWHCWNVLKSGATDSAPRTDVPSEQELVELGISGFIVCAAQRDARVVCASANSGLPEWHPVELPP